MNAIAAPPRRPNGTGMVGRQSNGGWRYRLPGGHVERGGFASREEAQAALEAALKGRDWKILELQRALKTALRLEREAGVRLEHFIHGARAELLIEDARARRAAERACGAVERRRATSVESGGAPPGADDRS